MIFYKDDAEKSIKKAADSNTDKLLFDILTPLDFYVRVTINYWHLIVEIKHPVMQGHENTVKEALKNPDQIRVSKSDNNVFLFYKLQKPGRWICAVSKRLNGDGFLVTAYPTDTIKEGIQIWPK
jgi:hypothetical protein